MFCKPPHPPMHPVYIVIFRGDDTDFTGNQEILVKIHTERDISGCKAYFKYMGNVQTFEEIPEDKELHLVFSREQTKDMPLGTWDAELYLIDEQGRRMTVNNRIHMLVTNSVHEAYFPDDPQAVTVVINANEYVKDAEVSQDGKTLTLTKRDGTTVSFRGGGGGGGTDDYNDLENKPSINLITLEGDMSSDDLGLQSKLDVSEEGVYNISVQGAVTSERAGSDANGEDIISTYARKDETYGKTEVDGKLALKQDALTRDQKAVLDGGPYLPATENGEGGFDVDAPIRINGGVEAIAAKFTNTILMDGKEVATEDQLRVTMQLVGNNPYTIQLDGQTLTFAQIKELAETRNAVIQRGQGTYRVTYIGSNEMMWDVTGTVAGKVQTGQIHIFLQNENTIVQRVEPKVLATKPMIDLKADKLADTVVAKIDEDRHDDSIKPKIIRVPIEFARKSFNAVTVKFYYDQDDDDRDCYLLVGYSVGDGGSSGVAYEDRILMASSNWTYVPREEGDYTFKFGEDISKLIPPEAKFLTFFFTSTDIIEDPEFRGTSIETGYATDEEVAQKKYQIQQTDGFFHLDHAPLMEFLFIDDPVARKSSVDSVAGKVDEIKETVSTDNRFLVNGTTAAIQTRTDETAEWTDEIRIDKGYDAVQGSTMVKLDKSVQTVTVAGGTLTVELPDSVEGTVRDLCLYVNNTTSTSEVTIIFPTGITVYKSKGGDNPKTNAQAGGITAYYFTEMPGEGWRVMRDELEVVA